MGLYEGLLELKRNSHEIFTSSKTPAFALSNIEKAILEGRKPYVIFNFLWQIAEMARSYKPKRLYTTI